TQVNSTTGSGTNWNASMPKFSVRAAIIPDGQGGVLFSGVTPAAAEVIFSSSGAQYSSPMGSVDQMLLGQNDTVFAARVFGGVTALNLQTGSPIWQRPDKVDLTAALQDGSVVVETATLQRIDSTGTISDFVGGALTFDSSYFGNDLWATSGSAGGLAMLASTYGSAIARTEYPDDRKRQSAPPLHTFAIFWCGAGFCDGNGVATGDDVVFSYYPSSQASDSADFYNFSTDHRDWVNMIQNEAIDSFRQAFAKYPIEFRHGTTHTEFSTEQGELFKKVPDQEFTAFVVGDWPPPGAGVGSLNTGIARVFYFAFMLDAQTALGHPELPTGGGWISFSPSYPPANAQGMSDFQTLMKAIGRGIGNAAAHEAGHFLQGRFVGGVRFPYMDCGEGRNVGLPPVVPCEGNNNFVYNFWSASGFPQEGGTSNGGQFFYIDQPGAPVIHWGPANDCWLKNYAIPGSCTQ
ncbi:MAG: PQQ-like beta-propeller repeat protein, partial [Acidobacteriales bacterium]|nr:PQQ-like beta-propeller repeat protein [Terriglobales bacterium]